MVQLLSNSCGWSCLPHKQVCISVTGVVPETMKVYIYQTLAMKLSVCLPHNDADISFVHLTTPMPEQQFLNFKLPALDNHSVITS